MKTGVDSYLTKLSSVFEASESIKVVPTVANFKFLNWKKLSSGAGMHLVAAAIITGLLSVAGQALALQKIGSNGPEVTSSQRCLKKLGYFNGPVSGKFASLTQNAVIKFQQANRIPADGVLGINTQQALQRACQGRTTARNTRSASRSASDQYPVLSQGQTGAAVTRLQQRLRQLGYLNANPNGNFGPKTREAAIKFQRNYGITPNGIVNQQTWNALLGSSPNQARSSRSSSLSTEQVRELQVRLQKLGFFNTKPTGTIGPKTRDAVSKFQRNYRLPVDGIANAQVLETVRRVSTGSSVTQQPSRDYLTVGDRGDNVALVQERLSKLGFSNTNPDGFFSDYTRESVISFQQYSRINATGNVDWPTWQALGLNSVAGGNPVESNNISPETPYLVPVNTGYATPENNRYVLPPANGYAVPGTNGNTLVASNPYRVIVPISSNDTLSKVQQYIPDAVTEQSHLGDYVNAGAFSDRAQAETLTKKLRSLGLDARVKFN